MVHIVEDIFGNAVNPFTKKSEKIKRFTLTNAAAMSVQVITLGATITSLKTPDASGKLDDVVLGYDDVAGYQTSTNPYFGATVGRVCNRIGNGRFTLAGREIQVSRNFQNKHHLHGGFVGFDKVHWVVVGTDTTPHSVSVTMQHISPDGHEGYPGEVTATVKYTLTEDNCVHVQMNATTLQTTVVNMTNHAYFNLAGHASGKEGLYAHDIMIAADKLTETDADSIPTGRYVLFEITPYDLRKLGNLGERLQKLQPAIGYDDNYCVNLQNNTTTVVAKAVHPDSGRWLEIASNQPGVQFYTANYMPDVERGEEAIIGKSGAKYVKQSAFCLETQKYPDAVNHANFPSIILNPGEKYNHEVIYKFGVSSSSGCAHKYNQYTTITPTVIAHRA